MAFHLPATRRSLTRSEPAATGRAVYRGAWVCFLLLRMVQAANAIDGKDLALNGNAKGAHACSACHGQQGEGRPQAAYPRLAGLAAGYLRRQLDDFANGRRESDIMHPIAKALTDDERGAITAFYESLSAPQAGEPRRADDQAIAAGASLANQGDWSRGLPGCGQCHGPLGQGVGTSFPKLAGQSAEYIIKELKAWKEGKRSNDPLHLMTGVATKLDDREIAAVAAYYSSIPPHTSQSVGTEGSRP